MAKFPHINDIAWGKIREVRVSRDDSKSSYSFQFDLNGRKQKMTITVSPRSTTYTLSTEDGYPLLHAIQTGKEVKLIDFSKKPAIGGAAGRLKKIGKIRKN